MVSKVEHVKLQLRAAPQRWLVTGAAGFIGSNLVLALLLLGQRVCGLDNFSTGFKHNLDQVRELVGEALWDNFTFIEGDIRRPADCARACAGVRYVLHQAAIGSVLRSVEDPLTTHDTNITGFLNMLTAARDAGVARFVYAASSSTYGDHPGLPKLEDQIGNPLSPYAVTKYCNRSEEHTSELQSHSDLHSFPTRRSSDLLRRVEFDLWRPSGPAEARGPDRQSAVALRRHQVLQRAVCQRLYTLLRLADDRTALLQCVRAAPGSAWRLRGRDPAMGGGADRQPAAVYQRRRRDQPRFLLHRQRRASQSAGGDRR